MNKKYILIGILLVLLLGIISMVSVYVYKTSPSYKVKSTFKEEIKFLEKKISNLNSSTYYSLLNSTNSDKNKKVSTKKPLSINTDFKFDLDITKDLDKTKNSKIATLENILNNAEINLLTNIDNQNKYAYSKLNYKYDKEKFSSNFYLQDDKVYTYSKDFFDNYITILDENSEIRKNYIFKLLESGLTLEDVVSLLNLVNKTIGEIKINDKILSCNESINIGNVSKETKKDTLIIDNELSSRFLTKLIANALNSPKALSVIQKIDGSEDISDTKTKLVNIYNQIKSGKIKLLNENKNIKVSIYMHGFIPEFLKQEVEFDISDNINGKFSFLKYNVDNFSNHYILEKENQSVIINTSSQSGDKSSIQTIIKENNNVKYIGELAGVISSKKIDATYNIKSSNLNIINGKIKYSQTFEKKKKNSDLKIEFNAENIDYGKGNIEVVSEINGINSFKKQEIKNEVNLSELDENGKNLIKVKILKKLPSIYGLIK